MSLATTMNAIGDALNRLLGGGRQAPNQPVLNQPAPPFQFPGNLNPRTSGLGNVPQNTSREQRARQQIADALDMQLDRLAKVNAGMDPSAIAASVTRKLAIDKAEEALQKAIEDETKRQVPDIGRELAQKSIDASLETQRRSLERINVSLGPANVQRAAAANIAVDMAKGKLAKAIEEEARRQTMSPAGRMMHSAAGAVSGAVGQAKEASSQVGGIIGVIEKILSAPMNAAKFASPGEAARFMQAQKDLWASIGQAFRPVLEAGTKFTRLLGDFVVWITPSKDALNSLRQAFSAIEQSMRPLLERLSPAFMRALGGLVSGLAFVIGKIADLITALDKWGEKVRSNIDNLTKQITGSTLREHVEESEKKYPKTMGFFRWVDSMLKSASPALGYVLPDLGDKRSADSSWGKAPRAIQFQSMDASAHAIYQAAALSVSPKTDPMEKAAGAAVAILELLRAGAKGTGDMIETVRDHERRRRRALDGH